LREEARRKSPAEMVEVAGEAVAALTGVEVAAEAVAAETAVEVAEKVVTAGTAEERGRPDTKHPLAEAPTG
jgi:hypothetical protein